MNLKLFVISLLNMSDLNIFACISYSVLLGIMFSIAVSLLIVIFIIGIYLIVTNSVIHGSIIIAIGYIGTLFTLSLIFCIPYIFGFYFIIMQ